MYMCSLLEEDRVSSGIEPEPALLICVRPKPLSFTHATGIRGILVAKDGHLYLDTGLDIHPIQWPDGYTVSRNGPHLEVYDLDVLRFTEGEKARFSGSFANPLRYVGVLAPIT